MSTHSNADAPATAHGSPLVRLLIDASAAVVLCVVLVAVYALDRDKAIDDGSAQVEPPPPPPPPPPDELKTLDIRSFLPPIDPEPRIKISGVTGDGRFGIMTTTGDPADANDDNKKLTFSDTGSTNNTCVWVDDASVLFGSNAGVMQERMHSEDSRVWNWVWDYHGVRFKQSVELVAGEVSRRTDTFRITYTMTNTSNEAHTVGLRVMIDTLIGGNDGVPFTVPSRRDAVLREPIVFVGDEVPSYLHAIQNDKDIRHPGVVVRVDGLRPQTGEAPTEVVLSHWPGSDAPWTYDRVGAFNGDTALGVYYARKPLSAGQTRTVSFSYGLAAMERGEVLTLGKVLTLNPGQAPKAGGSFNLYSLVQPAKRGQTVTLTLPKGMTIKDPSKHPQTQSVRERDTYDQINWLVAVDRNVLGNLTARVRLEPDGKEAEAILNVQPADSNLFLKAQSLKNEGDRRGFWVFGFVHAPKEGQTLELQVAGVPGVALHPSHPAVQKVPPPKADGYGRLQWYLPVASNADGTVELTAILKSNDGKELRAGARVSVKPRPLDE